MKIVRESPEILQRAKNLGFILRNWKENGELEGKFHKDCFAVAVLVWQAAFHTRKFSPRRDQGLGVGAAAHYGLRRGF